MGTERLTKRLTHSYIRKDEFSTAMNKHFSGATFGSKTREYSLRRQKPNKSSDQNHRLRPCKVGNKLGFRK